MATTLVLSFAFQAAYGLLLSLSYREGDMSQVYPIMRGTGMFLVPLLGMLIWHGSLSVWGWLALLIMLLCFSICLRCRFWRSAILASWLP